MASQQDLARLTVQLELQTAAFESAAKEMDRTLKRMEARTNKSGKAFDTLNKTLKRVGISFGALAGALSVDALARATKNAIEFGDTIAKTASKVGVSVEELQELRFAAKQSGVDVRQLDLGIQRFARRMGEAAKGTGELLKTTQELGIEFKNADGTNKSTVELLEQYAEAVGRATTQQEKLRLAFKAFDSEGAALVNLIGDGGEKMAALRQEAADLGLVLSSDLTVVAEDLNDQLNILSTQLKVGLSESLLLATYRLANFFGLTKQDATRVAFLNAEIASLAEEIRELESGERLGGNIFIRERAAKIAKYAVELNALREQLGLTEAQQKAFDEAVGDPTAQQVLQNKVEALIESVNPLNKVAEQLGLIELALRQTTDPAIIAALEELREKLEFGEVVVPDADPVVEFGNKVTAFISTLNSEANQTAEQLGIMYAALEQITDPALRAEVEKMIEALELGDLDEESAIDPDPYIASLQKIKDAADGFGRDFTNTIVDSLKTGELAFDDFAKSVLETIAKIILNEIFTQFFSIITGGVTRALGLPQTQSNDTRIGQLAASIAPAQNTIAREGEATTMMTVGRIIPEVRTQSQSPVTVNVNNYGNDEVSVAERRDSNGGIEIDVLIKNTVRDGFARGDFDKVMSSNFGARRLGY